MVAQPYDSSQTTENQEPKSSDFKWTTVNLQEVFETSYRLEAGVYGIEGRQARQDVAYSKWDIVYLSGENGLATAYHRPRFKRIYVEKSNFPIYQPAQINELYPKPSAYISGLTQTDIDALRVEKGQVLLTCSGTIGNCTYVRDTLDNLIFSHDVIRIEPKEYSGFVYAFLKSKTGFSIINTNNYGAVVKHLEPAHLKAIPIPNPPSVIKQEIHNLIEESFKLRDESNELLDTAQVLLKEALELPSIEVLHEQAKQFNGTVDVLNYSVPLSEIHSRLDGSYYVPIVDVIEQHIARTAREIIKVGDSRISQSVILPGRFKRVYVDEGNGAVFFGGKQLHELDPSNKKYLSIGKHGDRIGNDLKIHTNMTLITRSGTIAKVSIVPKHWEGWIPNEHVIRVVPTSDEIAGYLYAWLSGDYAYPLIIRYTYGAVVDEINDAQVSQISVPLLRDKDIQKQINHTVLEANWKRTEAYNLEQEALRVLGEKVIYAR